ncbi:beta-eliminating lyase-related protein [Rhodobacteraceae bacterium]|nr:beta-eliminating lyase-related protein [Paracoccaceae bacterium]
MSDLIDLSSDTCTRPSAAMLAAMANAKVGDESKGRDPSVTALCERVANLLGQQAAMFLPSGTMCNTIAAMVHCTPGSEVIAAQSSHVEASESGAIAAFARARLVTVPTTDGTFAPQDIERLMHPSKGTRAPQVSGIFAEQTHNRCGGSAWDEDQLMKLGKFARINDIAFHIDGARIMNAAIALNVEPAAFGRHADSVWMSFTKGLGCPVGSVLAGSKAFVEAAWEWKFRFGGGMRQAGVLAAACLYALDHNVERLAEDHANAAVLAMRLAKIDGVELLWPEPGTNMVFFDITKPQTNTDALTQRLAKRGIRFGIEGPLRFRAVTHLDVSTSDMGTVAEALAQELAR